MLRCKAMTRLGHCMQGLFFLIMFHSVAKSVISSIWLRFLGAQRESKPHDFTIKNKKKVFDHSEMRK